MIWKKWLKYISITLLTLMIVGALVLYFGMKSSLKQFYGGNTPLVDHTQFEPATGPVAIKNVNVLSPDGESFIPGQTVIIENGLIQTIDSSSTQAFNSNIVDGKDKYLIPGLIDSHVHLFYSPNDLLLYIANGVTQIREMIGSEGRLALKEEVENGRIGPRIWVASPALGTADNFEKWFITWTRQGENVSNAQEAENAIQEFADNGYDGVKIYSHLNKESYVAACKKAKELKLPILGHIPWEIEMEDLWANGQCEVAHIEELMNALRRKFGKINGKEDEFLNYVAEQSNQLAENLITRDIGVTSTLSFIDGVYRQKFDLDSHLSEIELSYANVGLVEGVSFGDAGFGWLPATNLYRFPSGTTAEQIEGQKKFWSAYVNACNILAAELSKRGVKIMAGTDANVPSTVPGFSLHDELESLAAAGMSNAQVLHSTTSVAAAFMNSNAGKIEVGYDANLVLLDKNPLEKIGNTRSINTVFSNGNVYDRNLLDQMLAAVKEVNDSVRKVDISEYEN